MRTAAQIGTGIGIVGAVFIGLVTMPSLVEPVPYAPAQPVVSATVPAPPPSPVTPVPAAPPVSEPSEVDEPGHDVVIVPVPLPHGDDDHRGWIHRRACRHTIWC